MELRQYGAILARRKEVIAITVVAAVLVAGLVAIQLPPRYAASTLVRITTLASGAPGSMRYDLNYSDRFMNTYTKIATSPPMLATLAEKLHLAQPPTVAVDILANTELMQLTVTTHQPASAARGANVLAALLMTQMTQDEQARGNRNRHMISLVAPGVIPKAALQPRKAVILSLGLVLGLIGGVGLAFLFENLSPVPSDAMALPSGDETDTMPPLLEPRDEVKQVD